jgi:hypothetical protein
MSNSKRMAVAAHLHVLLRRHLGRVTDVEWMTHNREYAMSLVQLAQSSAVPELQPLAAKLASSYEAEAAPQLPDTRPEKQEAQSNERYVGGLRSLR